MRCASKIGCNCLQISSLRIIVIRTWSKTNNNVVHLSGRPSNLTFVVASTQVRFDLSGRVDLVLNRV